MKQYSSFLHGSSVSCLFLVHLCSKHFLPKYKYIRMHIVIGNYFNHN